MSSTTIAEHLCPCSLCWQALMLGGKPHHASCENIILARLGEHMDKCELGAPLNAEPRVHLAHMCNEGQRLRKLLQGMADRLYR